MLHFRSNKIKILAIVAFVLAIASLYFIFNPEKVHLFPPCPFLKLTGYKCPGCGSQRAIHYLLHLQIADAFVKNPLLILSIPYMLLSIYFESFGGRQRFPNTRKALFGKNAILIIFILVVAYWIGRNVL